MTPHRKGLSLRILQVQKCLMATRGGLITFTNSQHKDGHPDHAQSFQSRPHNHGGQGISHT